MDQLPDIATFRHRLDELDAQMADPSFYTNPRKAADISREQQGLRQLTDNYQVYERMGRDLEEHTKLVKDLRAARHRRARAAARGAQAGYPPRDDPAGAVGLAQHGV